jgi:hypothetical protein
MREVDVYINLLLENGYVLKETERFLFSDERIVSKYTNKHNCEVKLFCGFGGEVQYSISVGSRLGGKPIDKHAWHLSNDLKMKLREYKINQILK